MADDRNPGQSGQQNEETQKRNNPFSEEEKHGDEQQRRAPGSDSGEPRRDPDVEQDNENEKDRKIAS